MADQDKGLSMKRGPNYKHGWRDTRTYYAWRRMRERCSPKCCAAEYPNYYGRGIRVCERWGDFRNFLADMGEKPPGYTIERINNDGNYEPSNCRWATRTEQRYNRRDNRRLTYNGCSLMIVEWATETGISAGRIWKRLRDGWSMEEALTITPEQGTRLGHKRKGAQVMLSRLEWLGPVQR